MKLFLLASVALALYCAVVLGYSCGGCDIDGSWRVQRRASYNDDEAYAQDFDGQVEWRMKWSTFATAETAYRLDPSDSTKQTTANSACIAAIPDRIYNYRWERQVNEDDEDDVSYAVSLYLYRGYHPTDAVWEAYCGRRIVAGTPPAEVSRIFVEVSGTNYGSLKGAVRATESGFMEVDSTNQCEVRFRAKYFDQRCLVKNDDRRYPTEAYCQTESPSYQGLIGGRQTSTRYGCNQYTWESGNGDIEETCDRMYFVNDFSFTSTDALRPGLNFDTQVQGIRGQVQQVVQPWTPTITYQDCEYKVSGVGWWGSTGVNSHRCQ